MQRRIPALWVASVAYAVGLAILVPATLAVAGHVSLAPSGTRHDPGGFFRGGWGWLLLAAGFFAGGTAYFFFSCFSGFLVRWASTVAAAVGGTIALISLPFVVFDVLGTFLAFMMGAFLAGLEAFLAAGVWTAIVLGGERAVARATSDDDPASTEKGPSLIGWVMLVTGCVALIFAVAGGGRFLRGLKALLDVHGVPSP